MGSDFEDPREDRKFTDVTLVWGDGQKGEAHKSVLISSNPFPKSAQEEQINKGAEEKEAKGGQKKEGPARQKVCSKDTFKEFARRRQ